MNEQSAMLIRAITGPVAMITLGVLFALDRFTEIRFHQTWPVLLIVLGVLKLAGGRWRDQRYYQPPSPGSPGVPPPSPPAPGPGVQGSGVPR